MTLVAGLLVLLRSATKITHKAQAITCIAAKWHVCATIDSFESNDPADTPRIQIGGVTPRPFPSGANDESDGSEAGDEDDDADNTRLIPAYANSTISFHKRQALGESYISLLLLKLFGKIMLYFI